MDEGIIKYDQSDFSLISSIPYYEYKTIEKYRKKLNLLELISVYDNGLGYGNISYRKDYRQLHKTQKPQFLISGSQTGHIKDLTGKHYTRILDYSIENFSIFAQGALKASSETITHAAIYNINPYIGAIIHIHHAGIWKEMIRSNSRSTGKWIIYGTYEMAMAVEECINDKTQGVFVMKGHEDGIIAYGPNLIATFNLLIKIYSKYNNT